jgi:transcription initiation factor TFIIIB Brf1 subunit/transcription initiation factor TFIIB
MRAGMDAAKDNYEKILNSANATEEQKKAAKEEYEIRTAWWEAAAEEKRNTENEMLSSTTEYLEATKAVLENGLAELKDSFEDVLTNGNSFENLTSNMSLAASIQEDILTDTNKVYEINKLTR